MFGITLAEVKAYLGYAPGDTSRDANITLMLDAAYEKLKALLGRNLERKIYKDTIELDAQRLLLLEFPVESVTEIMRGTSVVPETEYRLLPASGDILFNYPPARVSYCHAEIVTVEYIAGYAALPADLKLALFNAIQAADAVNKQTAMFGGMAKRISVYDVGVTDLAVPRDGISAALESVLTEELGQKYGLHRSMGTPYIHTSEIVGDAP